MDIAQNSLKGPKMDFHFDHAHTTIFYTDKVTLISSIFNIITNAIGTHLFIITNILLFVSAIIWCPPSQDKAGKIRGHKKTRPAGISRNIQIQGESNWTPK